MSSLPPVGGTISCNLIAYGAAQIVLFGKERLAALTRYARVMGVNLLSLSAAADPQPCLIKFGNGVSAAAGMRAAA